MGNEVRRKRQNTHIHLHSNTTTIGSLLASIRGLGELATNRIHVITHGLFRQRAGNNAEWVILHVLRYALYMFVMMLTASLVTVR